LRKCPFTGPGWRASKVAFWASRVPGSRPALASTARKKVERVAFIREMRKKKNVDVKDVGGHKPPSLMRS
jgi:hypothetical protein